MESGVAQISTSWFSGGQPENEVKIFLHMATPGDCRCQAFDHSRALVTNRMSSVYEGDMIRPLGLVTLNFGIAEYELDDLLKRLATAGLMPTKWAQRPIGQKLALLSDALSQMDAGVHSQFSSLLNDVNPLLEERNALIHGCILAGGRIVSGRIDAEERRTSANQLTALAEQIFNWKERLWQFRWKIVEPLLEASKS